MKQPDEHFLCRTAWPYGYLHAIDSVRWHVASCYVCAPSRLHITKIT